MQLGDLCHACVSRIQFLERTTPQQCACSTNFGAVSTAIEPLFSVPAKRFALKGPARGSGRREDSDNEVLSTKLKLRPLGARVRRSEESVAWPMRVPQEYSVGGKTGLVSRPSKRCSSDRVCFCRRASSPTLGVEERCLLCVLCCLFPVGAFCRRRRMLGHPSVGERGVVDPCLSRSVRRTEHVVYTRGEYRLHKRCFFSRFGWFGYHLCGSLQAACDAHVVHVATGFLLLFSAGANSLRRLTAPAAVRPARGLAHG
ncbi:hypothetical protein ERJ75_000801600 [Trypanosoma vivax]|nr:hypothetical protein ERJ75_000801600 [Trypanosoma vivax]